MESSLFGLVIFTHYIDQICNAYHKANAFLYDRGNGRYVKLRNRGNNHYTVAPGCFIHMYDNT